MARWTVGEPTQTLAGNLLGREFKTIEDAARFADMTLRGVLVWAGADWGSASSLAWAACGAAAHIQALEQEAAKLRGRVDGSKPMRAWRFELGAVYWVAARSLPEALLTFLAMDDGPLDDEHSLEIDELTAKGTDEVRIRDDGDGEVRTLTQVLAETKTAAVVGCSEWP